MGIEWCQIGDFETYAQEKLIVWFNYLVTNVDNKELRTKMWHNSIRYFVGDHYCCLHVKNLTP